MASAGDDLRLKFLESLDLPSCRIIFNDLPIVLVCGGPVGQKTHVDEADPPIASLRHAISNTMPKFEIFRPEEIQNWASDAIFKDLVSFERALASICSLIVIILESPGSMAELGAFSQLPEISEKLIVVCSNDFYDDSSFISLGILRFLEKNHPSRVKHYPWNISLPASIDLSTVNDIVADIQAELNEFSGSALLKTHLDSHCMVMITELIRIFVALKENEILEYLTFCGFDITNEQLKGKLFLLKSFRIVKTQKYSDPVFYLMDSEPYHKIRFASSDKTKTADSLRIETQCLDLYKSDPRHKNRHRAIGQANTK